MIWRRNAYLSYAAREWLSFARELLEGGDSAAGVNGLGAGLKQGQKTRRRRRVFCCAARKAEAPAEGPRSRSVASFITLAL